MASARRFALIAALIAVWSAVRDQPRAVAAETSQQASASSNVHHYFSKEEHKHDVVWGYEGKRGPEYWGTLSPAFRLAEDGKQQSPIDIQLKDATKRNLPPLRFEYRKERISAVNNGHTIQHNEQPGSFLHVGDRTYTLEQFHVHVPSEHLFDGRHAAMEVHLVHRSESGEVAVVAVLVQPGTDNPVDLPQYKEIPKAPGEKVVAESAFRDPLDILPRDRGYLTYKGSFTTPPCTEGVRWIVMVSPVEIRPAAFVEFRRTIGGSNRPVQPLFDRRVLIDSE